MNYEKNIFVFITNQRAGGGGIFFSIVFVSNQPERSMGY